MRYLNDKAKANLMLKNDGAKNAAPLSLACYSDIKRMRDIQRAKLLSLIILTLLFLLNDIPLIYAHTYISWLLIDYSVRLLALFIILYLIQYKISTPSEFGLVKKIKIKPLIVWSIVSSIIGIISYQLEWRLEKILPETHIMSYPEIGNPFIKVFDLLTYA